MPDSQSPISTKPHINVLNSPPSPIVNVDNNILWYIFSLNADMAQETEAEYPALFRLLDMSQVCNNWRELAIGSPSLWARSLDFRWLSQWNGEWRKEVIRRTEAAPLHIKLEFSRIRNGGLKFERTEALLRSTVNENWARIQDLTLRFSDDVKFLPDTRVLWCEILQRPAPSLESFIFEWPVYTPNDDFLLFSNEAPSLRVLIARNIALNLTSLTISNIRTLWLTSPISASELLGALNRMPLLRKFSVVTVTTGDFIVGGNTDTRTFFPQVNLPYLIQISLITQDWGYDGLSILQHIIPAQGCTLEYYANCKSPDRLNVELCRDILSTYSGYWPEMGSATKLHTSLTGHSIRFSITLPCWRSFSFHVYCRDIEAVFPERAIPTLLPALTTLRLDIITTLDLTMMDSNSLTSNPEVHKFFLALVSVKTLTTNGETINALTTIQSNTKVASFPLLEVLRLTIKEQAHVIFARDFFNSRVEMGIPADTITLKLDQPGDLNLDALEQECGLTVKSYY